MLKIPVLEVSYDASGVFKERPNRFLGVVDIDQPRKAAGVHVHIHDPGRLKELLYKGNKVLLRHARTSNRKTDWDLIAAKYSDGWVLVNSSYHRAGAEHIRHARTRVPKGTGFPYLSIHR